MKYSPKHAFLLLLSTLLLAACGTTDDTTDADTTQGTDTAAITPVESETETTRILPNLPETDLQGYEFNVAHWEMAGWESRACKDIYAEAENGDTLNDAVYIRNTTVEDKYNFTITLENMDYGKIVSDVKKNVSAGDDVYDLAYIRLYEQKDMIAGGYFVNFYTVPNIDLSKPWWDAGCIDSMTVADKLYLAASAINISDKNATASILFNKQIALDNDLPDLYQLVNDGKWTIDKMRELYSDVTRDVNGDGKMGEDDLWGFLGGQDVATAFFIGGGATFLARDENGNLYDSFNSDHNISLSVKIQEVMSDSANFYNHHYGTGNLKVTDDNEYRDLFAEGNGLFIWSRLDEVTPLRSMEADFGILLTPKYEEQQEDYYSMVSQHTTGLMSIPASAKDLSRTGLILEALAAESYYTVLPAYYTVALKSKGARDEESAAMLDIIFANRVYDLGEYFNFGIMVDYFANACRTSGAGFVSEHEKAESKIEKAFTKWVESIENLE